MYSGTTLRRGSGKIAGAHQKIDRVARLALRKLAPREFFPTAREILHFEGVNGPDGLKRKSPAQDEPWHYFDPLDESDEGVPSMIRDHRHNLIEALKKKDSVRAAFEAAWLSHAVVDGLTPAHHHPEFEEQLEAIRGESLLTRTTVGKKLVYPGKNFPDKLRNNWQVWGAKGVMTTHGVYEWGVASIISGLRLENGYPKPSDCARLKKHGFMQLFRETALEIRAMDMYATYQRHGWTPQLAKATRDKLAPRIVKMVALSWYDAVMTAREG